MAVTDEIRKLARAPGPEIADVAVRQGMRLLRDDGIEKVRNGLTSIAEVTRVRERARRPSNLARSGSLRVRVASQPGGVASRNRCASCPRVLIASLR